MKYYKTIDNGYISMISTGYGDIEITEKEYFEILNVIQNKPEGNYKLTDQLEWELIEGEEE